MNTINIKVEEACRVFDFLEKLHDFVHQPLNYKNPDDAVRFLDANYDETKELYYNIVWNWLPPEKQHEIEER